MKREARGWFLFYAGVLLIASAIGAVMVSPLIFFAAFFGLIIGAALLSTFVDWDRQLQPKGEAS